MNGLSTMVLPAILPNRIRKVWSDLNGSNGPLGHRTSVRMTARQGGVFVLFENGTIYQSAKSENVVALAKEPGKKQIQGTLYLNKIREALSHLLTRQDSTQTCIDIAIALLSSGFCFDEKGWGVSMGLGPIAIAMDNKGSFSIVGDPIPEVMGIGPVANLGVGASGLQFQICVGSGAGFKVVGVLGIVISQQACEIITGTPDFLNSLKIGGVFDPPTPAGTQSLPNPPTVGQPRPLPADKPPSNGAGGSTGETGDQGSGHIDMTIHPDP